MRMLAWLKPWRPWTSRYREEQPLIERWLGLVQQAAKGDPALALEIPECPGLIKGYGETHRRGKARLLAILDEWAENRAQVDAPERAEAIRKARIAALEDPEGKV